MGVTRGRVIISHSVAISNQMRGAIKKCWGRGGRNAHCILLLRIVHIKDSHLGCVFIGFAEI